jgi:hypothetical protein
VAPRAGDSARPPALGRPRPARAGPHALSPPLIYWAHPVPQLVLDGAVFLGGSLSRSRPSCLGRSLRSRRMRSASPNLDTTSTRQESAPIEEDGEEAGRPERADPSSGSCRSARRQRCAPNRDRSRDQGRRETP